jgi:RNA polymerase sigma-70 factor (ECF subfamily)
MENIPETILIRELKGNRQEAFQELFNRYKKKVYYFACRYLQNSQEIEEVVQEVFFRIWMNRKQIKEELSFSNYLFTITRNIIFDNYSKELNHKAYLEYLKIYSTIHNLETENEVHFNECRKIIDQVVESLPPKRKEVYRLKKEKGMSHLDIADRLGISVKTVETHLNLALKEIRNRLRDYL